jgi:hypothetical protein
MNATESKDAKVGYSDSLDLVFPLDLSEWVARPLLREWIIADVESLNWENTDLKKVLETHRDFEAMAVMKTLTFGYATAIFSSASIVQCCSQDPEFHSIRPKLPPRTEEFTQFRRLNRVLLKWSLAQVLTRALKTQFIEGDSIQVLPPGLRRYVVENATERLDIARHIDRASDF